MRVLASWAVIGAMAAASAVAQLGLLLGRSHLVARIAPTHATPFAMQLLAGLLNAIGVELFDTSGRAAVQRLLRWQNHRSAAVHEAHAARQLFCFCAANRLASLLYLVAIKPLGRTYAFSLWLERRRRRPPRTVP